MHISLAAEPLFHLGGFPVTNSLLSSIAVSVLLIIAGLVVAGNYKKIPGRFQNIFEMIIETLLDMAEAVGGPRARSYFPLIITIFLYILLSNWMGLLPGFGSIGINKIEDGVHVFVPLFRGATADLNTTLALALISFTTIQFYGFTSHKLSYLKRFINFENPIMFFTGILELISELAKIISFSFRLFGNVLAGEVLLAVIASLIPVLASFPFLGLEIFVGFIQALVFAMLTLVFINSATISHGESDSDLRVGEEVEHES